MTSSEVKLTGKIYRFKDAGIQLVLSEPYSFNGKYVVEVGQPYVRLGSPMMVRLDLDGKVKWSGVAYVPVDMATHVYTLGPVEDGYRSITPDIVRIIPKKKRTRRKKK